MNIKYNKLDNKFIICLFIGIAIALFCLTAFTMWDRMVGNLPLIFYGKVVDQTGTPVPGATMRMVVMRYPRIFIPVMGSPTGASHDIEYVRTTDDSGRFSLWRKSGYSLTVSPPEITGYWGVTDPIRRGSFWYNQDPDRLGIFRPAWDKPIIFRAWKEGYIPPIIRWQDVRLLPSDWKHSGRIDLLNPKIQSDDMWRKNPAWLKDNQTSSCGLRLHIDAPPFLDTSGTPRPWAFTVDAELGGIQEAKESLNPTAPEAGYLSELKFGAVAPKTVKITKYLYFRDPTGQVYAGLKLVAKISAGTTVGGPAVIFTYVANTTGSREVGFEVEE